MRHLALGLLLGIAAVGPASSANKLAFVEVERDGIGDVDGLRGNRAVTVSPDGAHVYAAGGGDDAVAVFERDVEAATLTFVEVQRDGVAGVDGLSGASAVLVSQDGAQLYVAGFADNAVVVFGRDPSSGRLAFVNIQRNGVASVEGVGGPAALALSPGGAHLYAAAFVDDAIAVFQRDAATGRLTFVEAHRDGMANVDGIDGASSVAVSGDGLHVYAAGLDDNAIAVFARDPVTGRLTFVETQRDGMAGVDGLEGASSVTLSADGAHLYVTGSGESAVAAFSRDASSGKLTFVETQRDGTAGVVGLAGAGGSTLGPDGAHLYVAASGDDAIAVFRRESTTGRLAFVTVQRDGVDGVEGLAGVRGAAITPDGTALYTAGFLDASVSVFRVFRAVCGTAPDPSCRPPTTARGSRLTIHRGKDDTKHALRWRTRTTGTAADLGDPSAATDLVFCLYATAAGVQPTLATNAPAAGRCDGRRCWKRARKGFRYRNRALGLDGLRALALAPHRDGSLTVRLSAAGENLRLPGMPLGVPVTAELRASTGACWGVEYEVPAKNDTRLFTAIGGP
jgi:6-phosphogluconolactonase (cycloisomerase 2 family)